jgi:hypothetical protein
MEKVLEKAKSCCNCVNNDGSLKKEGDNFICNQHGIKISSDQIRYVCNDHTKTAEKNAPNYRRLDEQGCCNNCIHVGWENTGNHLDCFKYNIEFSFDEHDEYYMICDSYIKRKF